MRSAKFNGTRCRELREQNIGPLSELVSMLDGEWSFQTLSAIENGTREPSSKLFVALCRVFNVKPSELILEEAPDQKPEETRQE